MAVRPPNGRPDVVPDVPYKAPSVPRPPRRSLVARGPRVPGPWAPAAIRRITTEGPRRTGPWPANEGLSRGPGDRGSLTKEDVWERFLYFVGSVWSYS